ncbi:MAG: FAD-binding oxidoreductase, partial [Polyangiaceae bacterium]|nr:FAD-binding oxidoreductase [Polyangiaceae bacterium]
MIPRLSPEEQLVGSYRHYLEALGENFSGEIQTDYATRLVTATDNSVYQVLPQAVVYPANLKDIQTITRLLSEERFSEVRVSPRGGGTGTNGQALCDGVIVDLSKHFREILELNLEEGWVRVQPGVVLDQLNTFLAPHGVFFAPNLSPSSRATIGGMINTDASGKGSRVYGKTSDHTLAMKAVLIDGSLLETRPLTSEQLREEKARDDAVGRVYREVEAVIERSGERLKNELPQLSRFLTGYDLTHTARDDGLFDLGRVLTGSEGTLGFITEATLNLSPIPSARQLVAIRYGDFDDALQAAQLLVRSNPGAIETIDDTIVGLAKGDTIWTAVAHLVGAEDEPPVQAINLVEFESDDLAVVEDKVRELTASLESQRGSSGAAVGYTVATEAKDIAALWSLRKKGVGLLGNAKGDRRPVPFVEDTAVPPEKLADYIRDFRALLDKYGLRYGMFGHVDVGCLHVRPALNIRDEADESLFGKLSDEVVALVKSYGGVLWGEHGKGYRSAYTPTFFGEELYQELRAVKAAFDPKNQLNPGKLATPAGSDEQLLSIRQPTRGSFDRQIPKTVQKNYAPAINCNGNGACFDWNPDSVMCPSSKVTKERIHSPKGRAGILREWLRLNAAAGHDSGASLNDGKSPGLSLLRSRAGQAADFSHEVYDAMNGCLACKACATQCPIKVDIPEMRAQFYEQYHSRYRRPLKDFFVAALEKVLVLLAIWPRLSNWMMSLKVSRVFLERVVGMVDTPALAERPLEKQLRQRGVPGFDFDALQRLSATEKARTVLIAQDAFTSFYEPDVALAAVDTLERLGLRPVFLPWRENGKALHIKGFRAAFHRVVQKNVEFFEKVSQLDIPLIGLEPAVTLTYREEYVHALGDRAKSFRVHLLQEFLVERLPTLLTELGQQAPRLRGEFKLFG